MNKIKKILLKLYSLNQNNKKFLFIIFDFLISILSIYFSFYLVYGAFLVVNFKYIFFLLFSSSSFFLFFYIFKIYVKSFRFFNIYALSKIVAASFYNLIFLSIIIYLFKYFQLNLIYGISQSLILIYIVWFIFFIIFGRVLAVVVYDSFINLKKKKIVIFGLDDYVKLFLRTIQDDLFDIKYIFNNTFDSSLQKKYTQINELDKIFQLIDNSFDELIISENYLRNNNFISVLIEKTKIDISKIKILDKNTDFKKITKDHINFFKRIRLQDLINRDVLYEENFISLNNEDEVVLVTGGAGSIGSILIKELLKNKPKLVICLDSSEEKLFILKNTLEQNADLSNLSNVKYVLSNLNSKKDLENIFYNFKINTVYHAAAYKHVNIVEENKVSAAINNLCSFLNLIEISIKFNVRYFVLISSDKAVYPKSFMGLTKKICEQILIYYSKHYGINEQYKYFTVRFGNVFESSGSVIPIFKKQIEKGGPVTITSFDATRYFMSIPEAVNLILQAKLISKGSEIFILEMGRPIKILEIAKKLIFLYSVYQPLRKNIEIIEIGLRKGEKLHEELSEGSLVKTNNKNILISDEKNLEKEEMIKIINIINNLSQEKNMENSIKDLMSLTNYKC
jgi:nucleoside-diphosphate-sugar epimerase